MEMPTAEHTEVCSPVPGKTMMEREMSLWESSRAFRTTIFWCVTISTALIMESYSLSLVTNLPAIPAFRVRFGEPIGDGRYQVDATWQSLLVVAPTMGQIMGLLLNGIALDKFGHKKMIFSAIVVLTCSQSISFFAPSLPVMFVGFVLNGIPLGIIQTACCAYASDLCPVSLRGQLATYNNCCWVMGQLIASGVWRIFSSRIDEWSYRGAMSIQWLWSVPILLLVWWAPGSPWWYLRNNKRDGCRASLWRLSDPRYVSEQDIEAYMISMDATIAMEKVNEKSTTYLDCFRGTNLRRTEIVVMAWVNQVTSGSALMAYASYFFQTVGLSTSTAFTLTIALNSLGLISTITAWPLMNRFGRRDMYFWGSICMSICLMWMGIAAVTGTSPESRSGYSFAGGWAMVAALLMWTVCYQSTVGPICYPTVVEMPSTALKSKTINIGCAAYNAMGIPILFLMTRMLNPGSWNWGGKAGFFWGGITLMMSCWAFHRMPEAKGRTYRELNRLFEMKVPAREFKTTELTPEELDYNRDVEASTSQKPVALSTVQVQAIRGAI